MIVVCSVLVVVVVTGGSVVVSISVETEVIVVAGKSESGLARSDKILPLTNLAKS